MIRCCLPVLVAISTVLAVGTPTARAQGPEASASSSASKEAGKHFRRGVALYNETDYRGALAEFRRAYEIAPNAAVLYNIGEAYYQLQNYAAALSVFERYIVEAGTTAPHRHEVEQTLEILHSRVGKIRVTTNVPSCEVTVDDELVGKAPFETPIVVSVGRRKVTAMLPGRVPDTRFVEVAAGDTVDLTLSLGASGGAAGGKSGGLDLVTAGWVATGVLGAATIGTAIWAFSASHQLQDARKVFPTSRDELDRKSSHATNIAILADVLGAATVITGAVTLRFTLTRSKSHEVHVAVVPNGIQLAGSFH